MNTASLSTALGSDDPSSDKPDILVPLDPDGNRITWPSGSNPAYLPGIRYELGEYYKRKGLFQPLLEHRAVSLSNGKIAVETVESIKFLSGLVSSAPHSFDAPCPPSPQRIAEYDAAAAIQRALGRTTPALADITIGPDISTNFFINKYQVAAEDARLLTSIGHIFEDSSKGSELLKKAGGSGLKMLELLAREETKVKPKDVTLVRMQLSEYTRGCLRRAYPRQFRQVPLRFRPQEPLPGPGQADGRRRDRRGDPQPRQQRHRHPRHLRAQADRAGPRRRPREGGRPRPRDAALSTRLRAARRYHPLADRARRRPAQEARAALPRRGYEEYDERGQSYLCRVEKPIYGIPQAGRRLQRQVFLTVDDRRRGAPPAR